MSRVALISGGTSGIGAAIARALQAAGYRVAVNYAFTTDRAEAFQKETGIPAFQWDVRDYDACVNGIARVEETFGPVEVLVMDGAGHWPHREREPAFVDALRTFLD